MQYFALTQVNVHFIVLNYDRKDLPGVEGREHVFADVVAFHVLFFASLTYIYVHEHAFFIRPIHPMNKS